MSRHKMRRRRSPRRRSGARTQETRSGAVGYGLIALCVLIIGGGIWAAQVLKAKHKFDANTLCSLDGPSSVTVVLLDLTDPLRKTQQLRLKNILNQHIVTTPTDSLFSVGVVNQDPDEWGALFARCKPASGEAANALYENAQLISERYDIEFTQPLNATLDRALSVQEQNTSPIMEALQALIAQTPHFSTTKAPRKVIIVSDMLQNSETLSFYRGQGWDFFTKNNGVARLSGNLSNVSVEVLRIPRQGRNQPATQLVDDFWVRYFDKQGTKPPSQTSLGDL